MAGKMTNQKEISQPLLGSDSDSEDRNKVLTINKKFASDYERRKQKQELKNHQDDDDGDLDLDESSEDEDGELLTTALDTDIMKTLNALRSKKQEIYDPQTRFFPEPQQEEEEGEEQEDAEKTQKKEKKKKYKDIIREQILEEMEGRGNQHDDDDGNVEEIKAVPRLKTLELAYDDTQREIRQAFLQQSTADDQEENGDDFLVKKKEEQGEFQKQVQKMEEYFSTAKSDDFVDPKGEVQNGQQFLLDFFKNKSWIESGSSSHLPEDWNDGDDEEEEEDGDGGKKSSKEMDPDAGYGSDDSLHQLEKNDDFEARYNFRFETEENPSGAAFSNVGYARTADATTFRRKDDTRVQKRLARQERKEAERRAKQEQLKRLKNIKRKEMEKKIQEIKKVLGEIEEGENATAGIDDVTIMKLMEEDYDPEKMDKLMQEMLGEDYYNREDKKWKNDKDVCEELCRDEDGVVVEEGEGNLYDNYDDDHEEPQDGDSEDEAWVEEKEFNDDEYHTKDTNESNLEKKLVSKMKEELYKLDYEDIVAGIPTRFKYRKVEPNDYGLTAEEILCARDSTLKQYVSLKKLAPYRDDGEYVVGKSKRRMFRQLLERDLQQETVPEGDDTAGGTTRKKTLAEEMAEEQPSDKKRKRRRSKKKNKNASDNNNDNDTEKLEHEPTVSENNNNPSKQEVEEDTVKITTKTAEEELKTTIPTGGDTTENTSKKRRRRRRKKNDGEDPVKGTVPSGQKEEEEKEEESKQETPIVVSPHSSGKIKVKDSTTRPNPVVKPNQKREERRSADPIPKSSTEKKSKKHKKSKVQGMTSSRLSSYGI